MLKYSLFIEKKENKAYLNFFQSRTAWFAITLAEDVLPVPVEPKKINQMKYLIT